MRKPGEESEHETRKKRIDAKLRAAGWKILPFVPRQPLSSSDACAIEEYPTSNGPADYALVVGGRILGIVEAKKLSIGPKNVLTQAERYSKGVDGSSLNFRGYRVPFLYSTNGEVLWHHDIRHPMNCSREIALFHTPAAIEELISRDFDSCCDWFASHPNTNPMLRPYQVEANTCTEKAIAERKRRMLLAMATGTGKTYTLVNQIYRLMESKLAGRVLFLVDRRALAAQAVRALASFDAEPSKKFDKLYEVYSQRFQREDFGEDEKFDPKVLPASYLKNPKPKHAFVYVCTIQRMAANLFGREAVFSREGDEIDSDAEKIDIPIHAFDVIIADECHRGYTTAEVALWRKTLDHFDAIKIGLTATPAAHTKAYFTDVVFRYEYSRAVREGYLVDYDVVTIKSGVRMNGVFLKEGEHVAIVNPDTGAEGLDMIEDERQFDASEVERKVTSPDSNRKILEEIKKFADEHEKATGRFPKTLIFAVNDLPHTSHADQLVELAVKVLGRGESFVRKITGRVDRPLQRIREFRNRPEPGVVVSVDLMSTGVDIPDLEYIVFLRPVQSRILFEQMLGRGTRKGEKFPDKSHFTVFDCFDGSLLAYFRQATGITIDPPEKPSKRIEEIIADIWDNRDREYNIRCLVKRLQRIAKEMSGEALALFEARGIPEGDLARFARELPERLKDSFTETMRTLRQPSLIDLFNNYPRRPPLFVKATENVDEVTSQWFVRDGDGREIKPDDYIEIFHAFVRKNPDKIQAISILLRRPKNWSTRALEELRKKLAAAEPHFTEDTLQKAHQIRYHVALADIISMVKHAASEREPLLTAPERIDRAVARLSATQEFTDEQRQWLDRIREHLVRNLTIDSADFEEAPILMRAGGWGKADQVFEGKLADLIVELNGAVAA